ncbi:hypothetical protein, partial [Mycobacteroides abscessus]|uniref:hypothetical protein n=1 Tax=Mycobacteroides abscessus TaxID=36809 RepID=UPI001BB01459
PSSTGGEAVRGRLRRWRTANTGAHSAPTKHMVDLCCVSIDFELLLVIVPAFAGPHFVNYVAFHPLSQFPPCGFAALCFVIYVVPLVFSLV